MSFKKFALTNNLHNTKPVGSDCRRSAAPQVTTAQQDHHIQLQHLQERYKIVVSTVRLAC
jgi:hypothetical protein